MDKENKKELDKEVVENAELIEEEKQEDSAEVKKADEQEEAVEASEVTEEPVPAKEDDPVVEEKAAEDELELDLDSAEDSEDAEEADVELTAEDAEETDVELTAEDAEETEVELIAEDAEETEVELTAEDAEEAEVELNLDDAENVEDAEERNKRLKKAALIIGGVLLVVYLGFALFFNTHFYFNTYINGYNYSLNKVSQVEEYREKLVDEYVLTLKRSDRTVEKISGDNLSIEYVKDNGLKDALKSQHPLLWPISIFQKQELEVPVGVSYDDTKLQERIDALNCMKPESQTPPVSAHPTFDGTKFVVKEEEIGSQINVEEFNKIVRANIDSFDDELNMVDEQCYVPAKFLKDAPEVAAACDVMNNYLGAQITYTFGSNQEVVGSEKISTWLTTDENMQVTFQKEQVSAYIAELAAKYDTYKKERTFTGGNGNTVKVTGGDYGWKIDQEAEYAALVANIENKEVITKEPVYAKKAATHDGPDWGNTYVELDLTNQRVYLFINGKLIDSSPCVTGNVSQGNATPQGVYSIKYCQRGATLRGPKQPDGTYEWESPVRYWMPFNGGIGLHDADWRSRFGGSIYRYDGSHGCVNLPIPFAKTVFNNVSAGTPVVCHY